MTREFGPDILMQLGGDEAAMVEKILDTVTAAYNTLSDVVKKERYDELLGSDKIGLGRKGDDRFQAQVQFQSGKVFLEMEDWDSAEKALQDACNIEAQNGVYLAHLAWAIYRNPANANSRAVLEKARQMLNRSLTLERSAEGFAFKGQILLDGGQEVWPKSNSIKPSLNARLPLARTGLRRCRKNASRRTRACFAVSSPDPLPPCLLRTPGEKPGGTEGNSPRPTRECRAGTSGKKAHESFAETGLVGGGSPGVYSRFAELPLTP